ncbi:hypothetical protein Val02_27080 [Virgisporangium aliadipatigenens]|uniref:Smf/DprA SLOG domain-containing protein n=1 Tax=Virgisporangium aliadipatigenens TaxID=741659 RepID=A0A8J4DQZ2_9ACTN|nr:DNA-processing protein DprA [Virgisporangium aliadipatigenens]GIJ45822.1 hypothetical protein Val02_27080 [Virgisporangium aliadipatigenens]
MTDRRIAWLALGSLAEPGNREIGELVRATGPVHTLERACAGRLSETLTGAMTARLGSALTPESIARHTERLTAEADRLGARITCPDDADWPQSLADLARISRVHTGAPVERDTDPPLTLWARGALPLADTLQRSVAIVGARAATSYGEFVAGDLAHALAAHDWTVVSGGALGIDAAAHRAALNAGGRTVAVLACGIDRPYPVSNTGLFEQIGESGLLLTEWPPGSPPHRVRFLVRNRVIAALSAGTVVVEAARRSGSRQTLHRAAQLGRIPMVVPGPVTSPKCA